MNTVSKATVRKIAVFKQGLHKRPEKPDKATIKQVIRQMSLLQLDSISVTARSHYLVLLNRLGLYNRDDLDALLPERYLFEYWAHAACLIPMEDYPHFEPVINHSKLHESAYHMKRLGDDPQATLDAVLNEVRERGALSSKDFESDEKRKGSWWQWKPAKVALEYLYDRGVLMVSDRKKFHRYYDLAERVLEGQDFVLGKSIEDYEVWAVTKGLRTIGIATIADIADYYRLKKQPTRRVINALLEDDTVIPINVENIEEQHYIHKDDLALLEAIESGNHAPEITVFLSPFDNLIWHRPRVEAIFDFYYRVEMYTPAAKRQYGYYVLPILYKGVLIGRIDPKVDRQNKRFLINALHLEPDVIVTNDMVDSLVIAIREFKAFHHCEAVDILKCTDEDLSNAIMNKL